MLGDYPRIASDNRGTPPNMTDSVIDPTDGTGEPTTPDTGPGTALPGVPDGDTEPDQDAEPTMTAPPGERPDAGASLSNAADADDADAADADGRG
jgi:hypothetical protein